MKRRKLKSFVLPTLYLLVTISVFTAVILLGSNFALGDKDYDYGVSALKDKVESVIVEDVVTTSYIGEPVEKDKAEISVHFYSKNDTEEQQKSSLIYYENTYLPNTGTLYTNQEEFNVLAVFEGKVTDILTDEFFGNCVVVEHTPSLRTYYYGVDKLEVKAGDELTSGAVIGISKNNEIISEKKSFLLEVYYNNELINPETFIGTKVTDYK